MLGMQAKTTTAERRDTISVLMLVIVFLSLIRPVSPYIADGAAHLFNSEHHHQEMHTLGINHVDKAIKNIADTGKEEAGQSQPSALSIETAFVYFDNCSAIQFFNTVQKIDYRTQVFHLISPTAAPAYQPPDLFFV